MKFSRRLLTASVIASLSLGLAACDEAEDPEAALEGKPIAAIAAPDGADWLDTTNVSDSNGFVIGNPDAPIKLIEYASHTCGGCAAFSQAAAEPLKKKYVSTGVVSYELRNLVRDPVDLTIATLVRCGAPESMIPLSDQAWTNFDEVMSNVQAGGAQLQNIDGMPMEERFIAIAQATGLIDFFAARGLSADQARTCLADAETIEAISTRSSEQAQELGVDSTPTVLLNGQNIGNQSWGSLEPMLQRAGAR